MQLYKLIPPHLLSQHSPLLRLLPLRLGQPSPVLILGQPSRVLHPPRGLPCPETPLRLGQLSPVLLLGQPSRVLHLPCGQPCPVIPLLHGQPHQVLRLLRVLLLPLLLLEPQQLLAKEWIQER